jgi:uncharacterized membrane protein YphA (DoxX/SURF4 family)
MSEKKWEKMYSDILTEGKKIKRRRTVMKSLGVSIFAIMLVLPFVFSGESKVNSVSPDMTAEIEAMDEFEVAMVASDTFFDNDLGVIY